MALSSASACCTTANFGLFSFFPNVTNRTNFAKTRKFPAEIMEHDPMDIHASSAVSHNINHPPKRTRASFHQQVMLMSSQPDKSPSHIPSSHLKHLYHARNVNCLNALSSKAICNKWLLP